MTDNIKISVIMPSLNVEDYIEQCISSVINQTLNEIEIICVDAGSTDNTLNILKKYAEKDSRIRIIHSDKKSYGYQVNLGISKAKGEYISIIETDDFIELDMFQSLYNISNNGKIDIVKGTFYHYNDYNEKYVISNIDNDKINLPTLKKFTLKQHPLFIDGHPSIWAGIYRRQFLIDNEIKFMEVNGGGWVDNPFFFETAITAKSIIYTHEPYYYYRISNPNSSTNTLSDFTIPMDRILDLFKIIEKYNCKDEDILVVFYNRLFRYIEIILENNNNSDRNLNHETRLKIHEVVKKVDKDIVDKRLFLNYKKLYYNYINPRFLEDANEKKEFNEFKEISYPDDEICTVSIIMPIFNGARYLKTSVESILKQTLKNYEIIFVDDGSTDNTIDILQDYQKNYDFIQIVTQENSGSGKARNNGIKHAKGEYIAFLDADDFYIDKDALEKMYQMAVDNNADMVTANIKHDVDNKENFVPFGPFEYYTSNKVIFPEQYGIPWSFYKNIFKKEFLTKNNIYFPDLLRGQDPVFLAEVLTKVDKIYAVTADLYAYVYNSDTAKASSHQKLYDQLLHYKQVIDFLSTPKFSNLKNEYFEKICLFSSRLDDESIVDSINSLREIFKDNPELLNKLEKYISLKFRDNPEVEELIPKTKISVIMELSNSKESCKKSIDSILEQSIDNFELMLINGFDDEGFETIKNTYESNDIKFIEGDKNISILKNRALNESSGDYVYFCDDKHLYKPNLLENLLETSIVNDADICLCNLPGCETRKIKELNFRDILGEGNFIFRSWNAEQFIPYIFTSPLNRAFKFYKKSLLKELSFNEEIGDDEDSFQIKAYLNSTTISFVTKFLFDYITKNNTYNDLTSKNSLSEDIFKECNSIENYLREKSVYEKYKIFFDIYKINKITSFLDSVCFIGSYSYNDVKNRNLYANNEQVLDYSQYYGSKSENIGLNYSYANEYFGRVKDEFNRMDYEGLKYLELKNNEFSNNNNIYKYSAVLKSDNYEEYIKLSNFSTVEELKEKNSHLKNIYNKLDSQQKIQSNNVDEEIFSIENENSSLKQEIKALKEENEKLIKFNNQLRKDYWDNRNIYDYIISSRSWKLTKWLRKD